MCGRVSTSETWGDLAVIDSFAASESHFESITGVVPHQIACDEHPRYRSSSWARSRSGDRPVRIVGHHHAHVASVMGENGRDGSEPVLGIAFDGTGYGADGAVWGGELLLATYKGYRRLAHLGYVLLPGGDAGVERPYRMALAHLWHAGLDWESDLAPVAACPPREQSVLLHQMETGFGCVDTSSMGRLFDAVSSLTGVRQRVDYEAQAAIELEGVVEGSRQRRFAVHLRLDAVGRRFVDSRSAVGHPGCCPRSPGEVARRSDRRPFPRIRSAPGARVGNSWPGTGGSGRGSTHRRCLSEPSTARSGVCSALRRWIHAVDRTRVAAERRRSRLRPSAGGEFVMRSGVVPCA